MKIGIIGGTNGLGETLAIILKKSGFEITISGTNHEKGRLIASNIGVEYIENNKELASLNDILIISVPIDITENVIKEVSKSMKEGSLMIDVTSVKVEPTEVMEKVLPENIEYIPTHPIFGPRTQNLENQVIVLTPTKKGKWYSKVLNFLNKENMRVVETTAEKHDEIMAIVQVLTHFSYISTASAMEKLKVNLKETEDFESPIYNLMIDMIARIVSQNPYLTYNIQSKNNSGEKVRSSFLEAVIELEEVIKNKDEEKFIEITNRATKNMGDIQSALGRSDKAINSLNHEVNELYQSKNKEIGLKHIYSGKVHVGILKNINNTELILKTSKKEEKLKISNLEILTPEELFNWKVKNLKNETHTISCIFPKNIESNVIKETIEKIDGIIFCKIIDLYEGPQIDKDQISITIEVSAINKKTIDNVKKLLTGFGGKIR